MGVFKSSLGISGSFDSKSGSSGGSMSLPAPRSWRSAEQVVRPFELESVLVLDQPPPVDPDPEEETEARWGKASQFSYSITDADQQLSNGGVSIRDPNDDQPEEQDAPTPALLYREVRRAAFPIRIENPDDPDQYVIVSRIYAIVFSGNDGLQRTFILDHPT